MESPSRPADEVRIDVPLVRRLVAAQFPQWAGLPVEPAGAAGFDNAIFRLGTDLAVRLPRRQFGADHLEHEYRWLPVVGPRLPLAVPVPGLNRQAMMHAGRASSKPPGAGVLKPSIC